MRQHHLAACCQKNVLVFKGPSCPGLCFLKRYPFFASVCGPKTSIRNNYSIKCGNIIWQLAVTKVYSFLKAPIGRGFVLENLIHFWLAFVSQKHISGKNTTQNAAKSSESLLSQKYIRF